MTYNRNVLFRKAGICFEHGDTIVQVAKGLRQAVGSFTAGGHAARMIVGEYLIAVGAEQFDLCHIGTVSSTKSVIKHN